MNNPNTLDDFYRYWDKFYSDWKNYNMDLANGSSWNAYTCMGKWGKPIFIGGEYKSKKLKCPIKIDTEKLLPEPWWGYNDRNNNLHSVVINFNPGNGGIEQLCDKFYGYYKYSQFMSERIMEYFQLPNKTNNWLWATSNWHYKNRAKCLFDIIPDIPWNEKFLNNHLSIELIPWHSPNFNQDVVEYAKNNLSSIIKYSIAFAVEASKIIKNEALQNVVIFRCSLNRLKNIFDGSSDYEIIEGYNKQGSFENARCVFFKIRDKKSNMILFPKNNLVAIWQPYHTSMNNFPYSADMKRIFEI